MAESEKLVKKGFIQDFNGNTLLPITRAELVLDSQGRPAFHSEQFLATGETPGLITGSERALIAKLTGSTEQNLADLYNKLSYINTGLDVNGKQVKFYNEDTKSPISIVSTSSVVFSVNDNKITATVGSNIADKDYVDSKFDTVNVVATGALTFGGVITIDDISDSWPTKYLNEAHNNRYYKVTTSITISEDYLFQSTKAVDVKLGDTLIVHDDNGTHKFVHIPSGDEVITRLTINNGSNKILDEASANVTLNFDSPFKVTKSPESNSQATITLDASKVVSYTPVTIADDVSYKIGTITVGTSSTDIKGQKVTLRSDTYTEGVVQNQGLILKQGTTETRIPVLGAIKADTNGIAVNVADNSKNYLKINSNRELEIAICSGNNDGLVNKDQLSAVITGLAATTKFYEISESLIDSAKWGYGSENLKNAVTITI